MIGIHRERIGKKEVGDSYPISKIDEAYELFENKRDRVIKVAVEC